MADIRTDINQHEIWEVAEALATLIQDDSALPFEFKTDCGVQSAPGVAEFIIAGPGGEPG